MTLDAITPFADECGEDAHRLGASHVVYAAHDHSHRFRAGGCLQHYVEGLRVGFLVGSLGGVERQGEVHLPKPNPREIPPGPGPWLAKTRCVHASEEDRCRAGTSSL